MDTHTTRNIYWRLRGAACFLLIVNLACTQHPADSVQRAKANTWVFILAGQSNMAGRGNIEEQDTVKHPRIWSINAAGEVISAQEPLHFYEPRSAGLDCGMSFGRSLLGALPDSIHVLLIPAAVGGSPIDKWLGDSLHRNVRLMSNFREKVAIAKKEGEIKAVLWHQGEGDASPELIPSYRDKTKSLFTTFRTMAGNNSLLILTAETGSYGKNKENRDLINAAIYAHAMSDANTVMVSSAELPHKGDETHFNSQSLRILGQRYAAAFLQSSSGGMSGRERLGADTQH